MSTENQTATRETFGSRLGILLTMVGVAVGLGNVWRFPYMVGKFGGASFVLVYVLFVVLIGIPALAAEWALGRSTRRGPVGAFQRAGFPGGKILGWVFFFGMTAATAYYTNAIGWVLYHAAGQLGELVGLGWDPSAILPPDEGFDSRSLRLQMTATALIIAAAAGVLVKGLRAGIETVSKTLMPLLLLSLVVLIVRSLTLPGAWTGVEWYILKFDLSALDGSVMVAALGQAAFSISLGGTFMVTYGSYLGEGEKLRANAAWTALGDLGAGLLAGLAILPAVIALGMEPAQGPGLIFSVLPRVFEQIPYGAVFGLIFFVGLLGAAYLSSIAAFEVLVAGLVDNLPLRRTQAVAVAAACVFTLAIPPMLNMRIFTPWDLTFGSGFQTVGALLATLTFAWCLQRGEALRQLGGEDGADDPKVLWLYLWLRFVVPGAILAVGVWWMLTDVLGIVGAG